MSEFRSLHFLHGLGAVAGRRCEPLRCAASCKLQAAALRCSGFGWPRVARGGWVISRRRNAFDAFPWGAWPRDAAVTRTSKQAGKALRSQGHQYARVM